MNNENVISFPASETSRPEQALNSALNRDMQDVIVVGYADDELVVLSSKMTRAEALFLLEQGKRWAMGDEP